MSFFKRLSALLFGSDGAKNRSPGMEYSNPFLQWFNIGAVLTVLLPLLFLILSSSNRRDEGGEEGNGNWWTNLWGNGGDQDENNDNNNADGRSWWSRVWGDGEDNPDERGAANLPILFVYLYSLLIFLGLVWYANRVFRRGAFTLPLLTALLVFFNMALLLALVLAAPRGDDRQEDRERRFGLNNLAALTLGLMSLFSLLFFLLTRCRDHEYGVNYESQLNPSFDEEPENGNFFNRMDNNSSNAANKNRSTRASDRYGDSRAEESYNRERQRQREATRSSSNTRRGGFFS